MGLRRQLAADRSLDSLAPRCPAESFLYSARNPRPYHRVFPKLLAGAEDEAVVGGVTPRAYVRHSMYLAGLLVMFSGALNLLDRLPDLARHGGRGLFHAMVKLDSSVHGRPASSISITRAR